MSISELQSLCLDRIQSAASSGASDQVILFSTLLREISELQALQESVDARTRKLGEDLKRIIGGERIEQTNQLNREKEFETMTATQEDRTTLASTSRAKGTIERDKLVKELRAIGVNVRPHTKTIFVDFKGSKIGMAFATERQPDRWFLGLKDDEYCSIVLICMDDSGLVRRLILPKALCLRVRQDLSRDESGNVKFNVYKDGGNFQLGLNGYREEVTQYLENLDSLSSSLR